jgi:hypothetical protein
MSFFSPKVAKPPAPPPPPPVPTQGTAQKQEDQAQLDMARRMARGFTSTMLTGGQGVDDSGNTSKVLLGN